MGSDRLASHDTHLANIVDTQYHRPWGALYRAVYGEQLAFLEALVQPVGNQAAGYALDKL